MIQFGDGYCEPHPPVADSDGESVEAVRFLGESVTPTRRFDDAHPTMTLEGFRRTVGRVLHGRASRSLPSEGARPLRHGRSRIRTTLHATSTAPAIRPASAPSRAASTKWGSHSRTAPGEAGGPGTVTAATASAKCPSCGWTVEKR